MQILIQRSWVGSQETSSLTSPWMMRIQVVYSQTKNTCVASSAREEKKHHKGNHGCCSLSAFKDLQRPVVIIRSEVCFFFFVFVCYTCFRIIWFQHRERGLVGRQMLKFRVVENLMISSLHCQTEVQSDLPECMVPTSATEGEGLWGPSCCPCRGTRQHQSHVKEQEQNLSGLLLQVGITMSPNPNSTKKSSLNFNPT